MLARDKTLIPAVVLQVRGEERWCQLPDGSTHWLSRRLLATDVPADVQEGDGIGFEQADGRVEGATQEHHQSTVHASIGASTGIIHIRGAIAWLSGATIQLLPLPTIPPESPPQDGYLHLETATVTRGSVRCAICRPDGRLVSAIALLGRPARLMAIPTRQLAGQGALRLDSGPDGAAGIEYQLWTVAGPLAPR